MIKGITVKLYELTKSGAGSLGTPTYTETEYVEVENVLVAPASPEDILNEFNLSGRKLVYELAIPKTDTNTWNGHKVEFFGLAFRVVHETPPGIEALIPGKWNRKATVERYE